MTKEKKAPKAFTVPRTPDAVDKDYSQTCALFGHKSHQAMTLDKEITSIHERLLDLQKEYSAARLYHEKPTPEPKTNGVTTASAAVKEKDQSQDNSKGLQ